jgi:hypothetical protein
MTLVPSVTELILAELLYLQYEDSLKPIYLYINSTGTSKVVYKLLFKVPVFLHHKHRRDRNTVMTQRHLQYMTLSDMSLLLFTQ